ncbi:MAG: ribosome assembly RNA-binding protein YhbY [Clostridiales bacterium]|nr:ribosome assembly RNA-binding protein YhbY [Clostridiales bacterium]
MMTGKQRASLRKIAATLQPIFQIGKQGVTENLMKQLDDALEAREIIKITILETAGEDTKELCNEIAEALNAEPVQAIGSKFTIYRRSKNNPRIELN